MSEQELDIVPVTQIETTPEKTFEELVSSALASRKLLNEGDTFENHGIEKSDKDLILSIILRNNGIPTALYQISMNPYLLRYTTEGLYFFEYEERYFIKDEEIMPTSPIEKLIKEFTLVYTTDLFKKQL